MREDGLLPQRLVDSILSDRRRYNTPGFGVQIVAGPSEVTGRTEWEEQTIVDGIAKGDGTLFARDVSCIIASLIVDDLHHGIRLETLLVHLRWNSH